MQWIRVDPKRCFTVYNRTSKIQQINLPGLSAGGGAERPPRLPSLGITGRVTSKAIITSLAMVTHVTSVTYVTTNTTLVTNITWVTR